MDATLKQSATSSDTGVSPKISPRSERGFWSLLVMQFQGAYSDNILRNLFLAMIVGMGLSRTSERPLSR